MNSNDYWQMFLETGVPEYYVLYHRAQTMERNHVSDDSGAGVTSHTVQRF